MPSMAFKCVICGKGPRAGKAVSHSHRATIRRFLPNLQRVRIWLDGVARRVLVCTVCLRSGRVRKAA